MLLTLLLTVLLNILLTMLLNLLLTTLLTVLLTVLHTRLLRTLRYFPCRRRGGKHPSPLPSLIAVMPNRLPGLAEQIVEPTP